MGKVYSTVKIIASNIVSGVKKVIGKVVSGVKSVVKTVVNTAKKCSNRFIKPWAQHLINFSKRYIPVCTWVYKDIK